VITGLVNARHEAEIKLTVQNARGQEHEIETVLDKGFTGSLTLPPSIIGILGLPWHSKSSAILANGNVENCDIHSAMIVWDGLQKPILVQAIDNIPLLGMALLVDYELTMRVQAGGPVTIQRIP
jgi:clan AA aspartic protease